MLLLFSVRVVEWLPVWEGAVHSFFCACLRERLLICISAYFSFCQEDEMWDLILLISDHCLSIHFVLPFLYNVF